MKNTILKLNAIVDNALKTHQKGEKFFDKIDDELKSPKNEDIILKLFEKIYHDFGFNYNMVISGGFSDYIQYLIKHSKIICKGNVFQVSGSLTSHKGELGKIKTHKQVLPIHKRADISEQDFIFVDDSYFSGTTEVAVNEYLKNFKSKVIKTYVIYDGNFRDDINLVSLYNYFDHHHGVKKPVEILLEYLYKLKDIPYDVYEKKIVRGEITTLFDLKTQVNKFHDKVHDHIHINPFAHNESIVENKEKDFILQVFSDITEEFGYQIYENRLFKKGEIIPEEQEIRFGVILRKYKFCEFLKSNDVGIPYYLKPYEDTYLIQYYRLKTTPDDSEGELKEYLKNMSSILIDDGYKVESLLFFSSQGGTVKIIVQKVPKIVETKIMNWSRFIIESLDLTYEDVKYIFQDVLDDFPELEFRILTPQDHTALKKGTGYKVGIYSKILRYTGRPVKNNKTFKFERDYTNKLKPYVDEISDRMKDYGYKTTYLVKRREEPLSLSNPLSGMYRFVIECEKPSE